jgi:hypothetical protein
MHVHSFFVDLPEYRGSVIAHPEPAQKTGQSKLNWFLKCQLGPWENAYSNANIFRGSKSARPSTKVPRG